MPENLAELWEQSKPMGNEELANLWAQSKPIGQAETEQYPEFPPLEPRVTATPTEIYRGLVPDTGALIKTTVPFVTAGTGALLGAPTGPAGSVLGSALGYGIGKQLVEPPKTASEAFQRMPEELAAGATFEMGGQSFSTLVSKIGVPAATKISDAVRLGLQKLRPRGTPTDIYYKEAESAIKEIIANQGSLNLIDEAGNRIFGLPRTAKQFEDAIHQTKKIVFNRYDILAKEAGEQGLSVPTERIAQQLEQFANESVTKTMTPNLANYARNRAATLRKQQVFTPSEAQDAIAVANSSKTLKARYDKRGMANPDQTREAAVDAFEAELLRKELDNVVTNATGSSYQELKNVYGSLKSIEQDVRHRVAVEGRKNIKGFFDIGEFYSGAELANFLVNANPVNLARSLGAKAPGLISKYLNNPDRYVKNMFQEVESVMMSPEFRGSLPKPDITRPPTGEREPLPSGQPPTGIGPQIILPQTGARYTLTADGKLIPVAPMRETTFSPGPPTPGEGVGRSLIVPSVGGQAVRPAVSPGPEPVIPPRAPVIVQRPGTAPESSKVGAPLTVPRSPEGLRAGPIPRMVTTIGKHNFQVTRGSGGEVQLKLLSPIEVPYRYEAPGQLTAEENAAQAIEEIISKPVTEGSPFSHEQERNIQRIIDELSKPEIE